jgi:hypothetical protein
LPPNPADVPSFASVISVARYPQYSGEMQSGEFAKFWYPLCLISLRREAGGSEIWGKMHIERHGSF